MQPALKYKSTLEKKLSYES